MCLSKRGSLIRKILSMMAKKENAVVYLIWNLFEHHGSTTDNDGQIIMVGQWLRVTSYEIEPAKYMCTNPATYQVSSPQSSKSFRNYDPSIIHTYLVTLTRIQVNK